MTAFQSVEKEGKYSLFCEADKHDLIQMIKVNINSHKSCPQCVLLIGCDEKGTQPLWSSFQEPRTPVL